MSTVPQDIVEQKRQEELRRQRELALAELKKPSGLGMAMGIDFDRRQPITQPELDRLSNRPPKPREPISTVEPRPEDIAGPIPRPSPEPKFYPALEIPKYQAAVASERARDYRERTEPRPKEYEQLQDVNKIPSMAKKLLSEEVLKNEAPSDTLSSGATKTITTFARGGLGAAQTVQNAARNVASVADRYIDQPITKKIKSQLDADAEFLAKQQKRIDDNFGEAKLPEKVASGVVTGTILAPAFRSLSAATPNFAFGMLGALDEAGKDKTTPQNVVKAFTKGATLDAVFKGAGAFKPVTRAGVVSAATGAGALAEGADPSEALERAAVMAGLSLSHGGGGRVGAKEIAGAIKETISKGERYLKGKITPKELGIARDQITKKIQEFNKAGIPSEWYAHEIPEWYYKDLTLSQIIKLRSRMGKPRPVVEGEYIPPEKAKGVTVQGEVVVKPKYLMPSEFATQPLAGGIARGVPGSPEWSKSSQTFLKKAQEKPEQVQSGPRLRLIDDVTVKDIHGNKTTFKKGHDLSTRIMGGQVLAQDGNDAAMPKNQFEALKGKAVELGKKSALNLPEGLEVVSNVENKISPERVVKITKAFQQDIPNLRKALIDKINNIKSLHGKQLSPIEKWNILKKQIDPQYIPDGIEQQIIVNTQPSDDGEFTWYKTDPYKFPPNVVDKLSEYAIVKRYNITPKEKELWYAKINNEPTRRSPKHAQHITNRGDNYKETLIVAPTTKRRLTEEESIERSRLGLKGKLTPEEKQRYLELNAIEIAPTTDFKSPHWDQPNVVTHLLTSEYQTTKGEKVFNINETQSDADKELRRGEKIPESMIPHVKNWLDISLTQALKDAVESGAKYLSWDDGQTVKDRYDLSKHVDEVGLAELRGGYYQLIGEKNGDLVIEQQFNNIDKLQDYVGKDIAKKLIDQSYDDSGYKRLSGENLSIGAAWADHLYNRIIPKKLKEMTKKLGGRLVEIEVNDGSKKQAILITPEIIQAVQGGLQPMAGGIARYYRGGGDGSMPKGVTAQEVVDYEVKELGNNIKVENGVDLKQYPSESLQWLSTTKKGAKQFGDVQEKTGNFTILAKDPYGGVLVSTKQPDLLEEARKYKTAEEFVDAQGKPVYHGTNKEIKRFKISSSGDLGEGAYFTPDKSAAQRFAWGKAYNQGGKQKIYEVYLYYNKPLKLGIGIDGEKALEFYRNRNYQAITKLAKENGYDAVIREGIGDIGNEIAVFSPKQIKTKSQLTDIWNKAHGVGEQSLLEEARKYKTAEEFVEAQSKIQKPALSDKDISKIAQNSDNMGYTLSSDEKKEALRDLVNDFKKRGIKSIDAYHITNASEDVLKKDGIKGTELNYIGETSGNLRPKSTYILLDLDDVKLAQDFIKTREEGNPVVHIKIPIEELYRLNWDSNFNLTTGTYSSERFLGDIPNDWIQNYYKTKGQLTSIWNKAHGVGGGKDFKDLKLFHGSKGKVSEETKSFQNVWENDNQNNLLKELAKDGVKEAGFLVGKYKPNNWVLSDRLIARIAKSRGYDAVMYSNSDRPQLGYEIHDVNEGKFYAEKKELAELYAKQKRDLKHKSVGAAGKDLPTDNIPLEGFPEKLQVKNVDGESVNVTTTPNEKISIDLVQNPDGTVEYELHDGKTVTIPKSVAAKLVNKFGKQKSFNDRDVAKNTLIEDMKNGVAKGIRERRYALNTANYETNKFIHELNKKTTKPQREIIPFIIEKTVVPEALGRPELVEEYKKSKTKLLPVAKEVQDHLDEMWEKIVENTDKLSAEQIENYITHIWDIPKAKKQEVTNWFTTRNRFLKKRLIPTIKEGIEKFGLKPKTLDVGEIIKIHDGVANRVIENNKFVHFLKDQKIEGLPLIMRMDKAPDEWPIFNHPALMKQIYIPAEGDKPAKIIKIPSKVHPDIKDHLEVIFGSNFHHPVIHAYEAIAGFLKKTQLTISLFHHMALFETAVSTMGLPKTTKIAFNPVRVYKALMRGELDAFSNEPLARDSIGHGLQVGATADIPVAQIQKYLNDFAKKTKSIPLAREATKLLATFNEKWDAALWDYYHDALKLYGYETLVNKLVSPKRGDIDKQKEEIAQFVNDTFGGQNWDVLLKSPKTLQILKWFLLSPDWTYSTLRQALSPTGAGAIFKELKPLRRKMGRNFWIKAALYFGVGMNLLNVLFRKKDREENPEYYEDIPDKYKGKTTELLGEHLSNMLEDTMFGNTMGHKTHLFLGRYEDGSERYLRWGKQFRELPEMFVDASGFSPITASMQKMAGKTNPLLQLGVKAFTGSSPSGFTEQDLKDKMGWERVWGLGKVLLKTPLPFSSRSLYDPDKEFHLTDLAMPSSKGMTRSAAIRYFRSAIEEKNERMMAETYQAALRNNLPAYHLFNSALSSLKTEATQSVSEGVKTLEDVKAAIKATQKPDDKVRLIRRAYRIAEEVALQKAGIKLLEVSIEQMKIGVDPMDYMKGVDDADGSYDEDN